MKILKFAPIKRERGRCTCNCYFGQNRPIAFTVDPDTKVCFCNYCGNMVEPIVVLELMCQDWKQIERDYQRAREMVQRSWDIGTKFRPYKRILKKMQERMGRKGQMVPLCPHCHKAVDLEKLADGLWTTKKDG